MGAYYVVLSRNVKLSVAWNGTCKIMCMLVTENFIPKYCKFSSGSECLNALSVGRQYIAEALCKNLWLLRCGACICLKMHI